MRILLVLAFAIEAFSVAPRAAADPQDVPSFDTVRTPPMLARVAPSIVKVHRGNEWGTGFLFGTSRHVVTSYAVINTAGTLEVVAPGGGVHGARVVAWSKRDDLVVLELDAALPALPLVASPAPPVLAMPMTVLYEPYEPERKEDAERVWTTPIAVFGRIARTSEVELDLDVYLWGRPGDSGAPVVTPEGAVIGIVSHDAQTKRRIVATRVERALQLFSRAGTQGDFTRTYPLTGFVGLFFSPVDEAGFYGAGLSSGFVYQWLAFEFSDSFFHSDNRPTAPAQFESVNRFQFEVDAEVQLKLGKGLLIFLGPGMQLNFDQTKTVLAPSDATPPATQTDWHVRVRPSGTFGLVGSPAFVRVIVAEQSRFDVGFEFGRP